MTQQRRIYRVSNPTANEINRVLREISDRQDELEGFRGEGRFRANTHFYRSVLIYAQDDDTTLLHGFGDLI